MSEKKYVPNLETYSKIVDALDAGNNVTAVRLVAEDSKMGLGKARAWVEEFIEYHWKALRKN